MACFEPSIAEIHIYSDDDYINGKISRCKFSNIKLYSTNEIQLDSNCNEFDKMNRYASIAMNYTLEIMNLQY